LGIAGAIYLFFCLAAISAKLIPALIKQGDKAIDALKILFSSISTKYIEFTAHDLSEGQPPANDFNITVGNFVLSGTYDRSLITNSNNNEVTVNQGDVETGISIRMPQNNIANSESQDNSSPAIIEPTSQQQVFVNNGMVSMNILNQQVEFITESPL
jgi:hypothetical protein